MKIFKYIIIISFALSMADSQEIQKGGKKPTSFTYDGEGNYNRLIINPAANINGAYQITVYAKEDYSTCHIVYHLNSLIIVNDS